MSIPDGNATSHQPEEAKGASSFEEPANMPKYEVTAIWTRAFSKIIEIEAPNEDEAASQVKERLEGLPTAEVDLESWTIEDDEVDIESVEESEPEGEEPQP